MWIPSNNRCKSSRRVIKSLHTKVTVYAPIAQSFGAKKANSLYEAVKDANCLTIITDHAEFKNLNLQEIKALMADKPAIIDGRRIINPKEAERLGFLYYGIGLGK
ncbi:MAG: UDP binding domain-containing protein [Nitrososphaeria archaeon]